MSEAVGMAIVLSPSTVITAFHCMIDAKDSLIEHGNLVKGLERGASGGLVPDGGIVIPVVIKRSGQNPIKNEQADWILLKRNDGNQFLPSEIKSIHQGVIPSIGKVCVYHAPIEVFNVNEITVIQVTMSEKDIAFCSGHKLLIHNGLFRGSSGGLYASRQGHAFAMHVESVSGRRTISEEKKENPQNDALTVLSCVSDSNVHSYASLSEGVILSRYLAIGENLN